MITDMVYHVIDLEKSFYFVTDLEKAHIKAHFRKDLKTGKLTFIQDYDDSRHKHELGAAFHKGHKVRITDKKHAGKEGTVTSYNEKYHEVGVNVDGKYLLVKPEHLENLDFKLPTSDGSKQLGKPAEKSTDNKLVKKPPKELEKPTDKRLAEKPTDKRLAEKPTDKRLAEKPKESAEQEKRAAAFAAWKEAITKAKKAPLGAPKAAAKAEEKKAKYQAVLYMTEQEYQAEREKTLNKIVSKSLTPDQSNHLREGTAYIPLDLLDHLAGQGLSIQWSGDNGRGFFQGGQLPLIQLYRNSFAETVAHEFAHAIDHCFSSSCTTGFRWSDDEKSFYHMSGIGKELVNEFNSLHNNGKNGKITRNGEIFYKDNWVDPYEGRIYSGAGVGSEWFANNCQYFLNYHFQRSGGYEKRIKQLTAEINSPYAQDDKNQRYQQAKKAELQAVKDKGPEGFANGNASEWDRAKKRYPKLTKFIEENFGTDKRLFQK